VKNTNGQSHSYVSKKLIVRRALVSQFVMSLAVRCALKNLFGRAFTCQILEFGDRVSRKVIEG
jgi:hypothetical protein